MGSFSICYIWHITKIRTCLHHFPKYQRITPQKLIPKDKRSESSKYAEQQELDQRFF